MHTKSTGSPKPQTLNPKTLNPKTLNPKSLKPFDMEQPSPLGHIGRVVMLLPKEGTKL